MYPPANRCIITIFILIGLVSLQQLSYSSPPCRSPDYDAVRSCLNEPGENRGPLDNGSGRFEVLTRIEKQCTYDTPEGNFRIHYDTTGIHAVLDPWVDENPADGHPDFVNRCGDYFEQSWTLFDTLGYSLPPIDGEGGGGVDLYDVYMHNYMGRFGVCFPESPSSQYPGRPNDYTSYIYVNPRFDDSGYPDRTIPLRITAVHQFFHAVQYAYNLWAGEWFMENCATWIEDVLFDNVNHNYNFLPYFFDNPQYSHNMVDGMRELGMFVWPQYIYQNYGIDAIREIWERTIRQSAEIALDEFFLSRGGSLWDGYRDFMIWNYFTGFRDDGEHYEEGGEYPLVDIMRRHLYLPVYDQVTDKPVSGMGSNFIEFELSGAYTGNIRVEVDGSDGCAWAIDVIVFGANGGLKYLSGLCNINGEGSVLIGENDLIDKIVLIVTLLSHYEFQEFEYSAYVDSTVSVDDDPVMPVEFRLLGNYPNPFNNSTNISFTAPGSGDNARLRVFDISGRLVGDETYDVVKGINRIKWSGNGLPSGNYFYMIKYRDRTFSNKMLLLK